MSRRSHRSLVGVVVGALALTTMSGLAAAHSEPESDGGLQVSDTARDAHQHGQNAGHLPGSKTDNVDLVSKLKLKNVVPEKIADVGVLGRYAYLAAWGVVTCKYNGVHVVNIADVTNPRKLPSSRPRRAATPAKESRRCTSTRRTSTATCWYPTTRSATTRPASAG